MSSLLAAIPLLAPLAFAAVAFLASRHPGARPRGVERATGWAAVVGLLTAFVSAGLVAGYGTMTTPLLGIEGLGLALRLDALSVSIFVMVALLSVV
ncbi:MAG: oxidoreductase, partial [Myxococcota bacterium]